jgi:LysR family transcriptional regulator, regulator of abg operon
MTVAASDLVGLIPSEMVGSLGALAGVVEVPITDRLEAAELCLIRRRAGVPTPAASAFALSFRAAAKQLSRSTQPSGDKEKL